MSALSFGILDCVAGRLGSDPGYYRILVDSSAVKYLAFHDSNMCLPDIRGEQLAFSTVPAGDWNVGRLEQDSQTSQFRLKSIDTMELVSIKNTWHPTFVDWKDLSEALSGVMEGELQCMGKMYCCVYQGMLGFDKVVIDHDWYPSDIYGPEHETDIYATVDGHNIAPKFIAHVTENNSRVIGYMVEKVPGRAATVDNLPACKAVLRQLHALGVAYGTLYSTSFIVTNDHVYIHGFGGSYRTNDPKVLAREAESLPSALETPFVPITKVEGEPGQPAEAIKQQDNDPDHVRSKSRL